MRAFACLAMLAAVAVPLIALPLTGSAEPQDRPADYLKRPTTDDMVAASPTTAVRNGRDGKATINCTVTVEGALKNCRAVAEAPAGMGFGAAAVALSSQFLMQPEMKGGKLVASSVNIPLYFPGTNIPTGSNLPGTDNLERQMLVSRIPWQATPSYADVQAAYPAKARNAKLGGRANLQCKFSEGGGLNGCKIVNEAPSGYGFGETALKLAARFRGPATLNGRPIKGMLTLLPVTFPVAMTDDAPAVITAVDWTSRPQPEAFAASFPAEARAKGVGASRVVVGCVVAPNGTLQDCNVRSEDPAGLGFGLAAIGLSRDFAMRPWSEDGIAMVGRPINLPIRYENKVAGPGAAAASQGAAAARNDGPVSITQ